MPHYLLQASYTPEAWARMIRSPVDRRRGVETLAAKIGGRLEALYYSFGEHDVVAILEAPDNVAAAAASLAIASAGHLRSVKTTPLLTVDEIMSAEKRAGELTYAPPQ